MLVDCIHTGGGEPGVVRSCFEAVSGFATLELFLTIAAAAAAVTIG